MKCSKIFFFLFANIWRKIVLRYFVNGILFIHGDFGNLKIIFLVRKESRLGLTRENVHKCAWAWKSFSFVNMFQV